MLIAINLFLIFQLVLKSLVRNNISIELIKKNTTGEENFINDLKKIENE